MEKNYGFVRLTCLEHADEMVNGSIFVIAQKRF